MMERVLMMMTQTQRRKTYNLKAWFDSLRDMKLKCVALLDLIGCVNPARVRDSAVIGVYRWFSMVLRWLPLFTECSQQRGRLN